MRNILELSALFVCLGRLVKFFSASGRKNAGLWFGRAGISTQTDAMPSEINNFYDPSVMPSTLPLQLLCPTSRKGTIKFSLLLGFEPGLLGGSS